MTWILPVIPNGKVNGRKETINPVAFADVTRQLVS